jgi:hypothetical protein
LKNWLDKFRDDRSKSSDPRWLEKFRDDAKPQAPRSEQRNDPRGDPRAERAPGKAPPRDMPPRKDSPPRDNALRPQPPREGAREGRPMPRPQAIPGRPQAQPMRWGRPQDILLFAGLMGLSLVLGLAATGIALPRLAEIASPLEILLPDLLVIAVTGGFVYLVAGMRQGWAVWLLIAFCGVRLILYVPTFFHIESVSVRLLTAVYFILQAAAFWFVFTPAAKRWLAGAKRT